MQRRHPSTLHKARWLFAVGLVVLSAAAYSGCETGQAAPPYSYYEDQIQPIVQMGCAMQTTGCHIASPEGTAAGNLDLTSYDSFMRREDLLPAYGPYPVGVLLLKGGPSVEIPVETFDGTVTVRTDIRHAAGAGIQVDSRGYTRLRQWIEAGHARTGVPSNELSASIGECRHGAGTFAGFDAMQAPADTEAFNRFVSDVSPVLARCSGGSCHGTPTATLYLTCGETEAEQRWNYFIATQHLSDPVESSEMLRRPLSKQRGGTFHEGGTVFESTDDAGYQAIASWATDVVSRNPDIAHETDTDEGLRFFANRVQPTLVRKGCMFLNCHSPSMFHDLRLHGGSQGAFSRVATRRNYESSRLMLALESSDPNQSRIIAKNLFPTSLVPGADGIPHRGGSLLEDLGGGGGDLHPATLADCAGVDADAGDLNEIPAYCVLARWHQIERDAAIARGEVLPATELVRSVVWVSRPLDVGSPTDFDTYRPGADLVMAGATVAADGAISLGPATSLLGGCGLSSASADVRSPAVSWDASKIAFAARTAADQPLRLYWMNEDGSSCELVPDIASGTARDAASGILLHDFDPAFAPDGRLVFASTRGNLVCDGLDSCGPTRTPAAMQPNSNLYIYEPAATTKVRQLTFLLNHEFSPSFMLDGRAILTAEKREPEFHQFAGRRLNLDGGDYHPLFGQRPSVGFESATEVIELANRNFAMVAANLDATHGAGSVVIANRSIGPDQTDRDPNDRFYIASTSYPTPGAFRSGTGAFRSPAALPTGRLLVSCDTSAASLTAATYDFEICELDPRTGDVRRVAGAAGAADIDVVAVYARANRGVFESRIDEANGHTYVVPGETDAVVRIHDFPMLATLLFANTRTGRPINADIAGFDVLAASPPPASAQSFADVAGDVQTDAYGSLYVNDRVLTHVELFSDRSAGFRYRGGTPIRLRPTNSAGAPLMFAEGGPFTGAMEQREQMQFYPGEHATQSFPRRFFNGMCGGCHGSISGRELDIAVDIDILTEASRTEAENYQ